MTKFSQATFLGMYPKISPRLIPENAATVAANLNLDSGRLAPLRGNLAALDHNSLPFVVSPDTKTLYRHRNRDGSGSWLASPNVVNFCPSPVREDPYDRLYWTGDSYPRFTTGVGAAASVGPNYGPSVSYRLGVPAPAVPLVAQITTPTTTDGATASARAYAFSYVSGFGEEGPVSAASDVFEAKQGDTVTLTFQDDFPGSIFRDATHPARRRVYRTNNLGDFAFLMDVMVPTATATESTLDEALGETIPAITADSPPDDDTSEHADGPLLGLTSMPGGILAGFSGRTLFFCDAYLPASFPKTYSLTTRDRIVALASVSIGLVILTEGKPALATGSSPASMSLVEIDDNSACLSVRSVADMGDVAIYAGPEGLVAATESGFQNLTKPLWSREQWVAMKPANMIGFQHAGRYLLFYDNGSEKGGYLLDFSYEKPQLIALDFYAHAGFHDQDGALYLAIQQDATTSRVHAFDSGETLQYDYQSRELRMNAPINPGCALIDAEEYTGYDNAGQDCIRFDLIGDGLVRHTHYATDGEMFRLPDGYLAKDFQYRLRGKGRINAVHVAEQPQELMQ